MACLRRHARGQRRGCRRALRPAGCHRRVAARPRSAVHPFRRRRLVARSADNAALDEVIATWAPNRAARGCTGSNELDAGRGGGGPARAIGGAAIHWGLPWGARKVAFLLPASVTRSLGEQTLATLDRTILQPTVLTHERQLSLQAEFTRFLRQTGDATPYQIEFRAMKGAGANAFALPSGVIVITDDLVQLAHDDREVVGVLAHECGHIVHRHTLRAVLQNSAVFVLIALITGDVSSATAFGSALPTFLLQNRFSREFEREADAHAVAQSRKAGIRSSYSCRHAAAARRQPRRIGLPTPRLSPHAPAHTRADSRRFAGSAEHQEAAGVLGRD
jgi:hypothetical protein